MKRHLLFALSFIIAYSFIGCTDTDSLLPDNPEDNYNAEYVLGEHTVIYDESMTQHILKTGADYFILAPSTPSDKIPPIGKIICCPITEQTPSGFLGRVTEVSSNANGLLIKCENVALEEAFSTLKINASINLSEYIEKTIDENGDIIEYKMVESELLDSLSRNPDDIPVVLPNSKAAKDESFCISLGVENKSFQKSDVLAKFQDGDILVDYVLDVNIDIEESQVNEMKFSLETHSGIRGFLNILNPYNEKNELCFMDADMTFEAIPVGPVVLKPDIRSRFSVHAEDWVEAHSIIHVLNAENDWITKLEFALEHTRYNLEYNGKWSSDIHNLAAEENNYFKLCQLAIRGKFGFKAEADWDLGLYNSGSSSLCLSTESLITARPDKVFYLDEDSVIGSNHSLNFDQSKNANFKFNSLGHSYDNEVNLTPESYPIQILPVFKDLKAEKTSDTEIKITYSIKSESILDTWLEGIALFKDKELKDKKETMQVFAPSEPSMVIRSTFIDTDDTTQYYVTPHIIHNLGYYYGKPVKVTESLRHQLIRLYHDTNGNNWENNTNWCSDKPLEEWYGISKDEEEEDKYHIEFVGNNLSGEFTLNSSQIKSLVLCEKNVTHLNLTNCSSLERLGLSSTVFPEGPLPPGFDYSYTLRNLDVSGCTALKELTLAYNSITSLDLSGCPALKDLMIRFSDSLTSLDLSNNISIQNIVLEDNKILTDLDVSGCTTLEVLSCSRNALTSLNASRCTALEELVCPNNALRILNVSGCISLKALFCTGNESLTYVDISSCTALEEFVSDYDVWYSNNDD